MLKNKGFQAVLPYDRLKFYFNLNPFLFNLHGSTEQPACILLKKFFHTNEDFEPFLKPLSSN